MPVAECIGDNALIEEATQARQKFLFHDTTPSQAKCFSKKGAPRRRERTQHAYPAVPLCLGQVPGRWESHNQPYFTDAS
jgi:hypothetical protein